MVDLLYLPDHVQTVVSLLGPVYVLRVVHRRLFVLGGVALVGREVVAGHLFGGSGGENGPVVRSFVKIDVLNEISTLFEFFIRAFFTQFRRVEKRIAYLRSLPRRLLLPFIIPRITYKLILMFGLLLVRASG